MPGTQVKRKLGWLELGFYVAGVALLAVFFYVKADGERMRQEGLEAFRQAASDQAGRQDEPAASQSAVTTSGVRQGSLPDDSNWIPDQELWADGRKEAFEESRVQGGEPPLAALTIGKLGIEVPVYDGTEDLTLNRGVGRIRGTARIDSEGNLGIAGHRDSFFRPLKDIVVGDKIDLQTASGTVTYQVSSITIVEPDDVSVLAPTRERTLTLVTCYPFYYVGRAPKRYIVKATAEHFLAKT